MISLVIQKSHTCEKGGAHLRISVWYLMNLKNNYLFEKTVAVGQ